MKVAQVCARYHPYLGGIETHVRKVSEALQLRGVEVEVLTTDPSGKLPKEETLDGVLIRRFKSTAPMESFYFSGKLKSYLRRHYGDYDVIHAHSYHDFPALYCAQVKEEGDTRNNRVARGGLFVFTPHYHGKGRSSFTSFLHLFYRPFYGRKIFDEANLVVCVSKYEESLVKNDFPDTKEKVIVIPNGVDIPIEKTDRPSTAGREGAPYIMYVGRLEPYKRVDRLVRAMVYLRATDVRLVIVGSGPSKGKILKIARDLGLESKISFFENIGEEELDQRYRNASVVVNLSKFEAYGLTVAEALARGTPCVVSESSALTDWVDGVNCFGVIDSDKPKLIATAIELAMRNRVKNLKLQNWTDVARKLLEVYTAKAAR